jgi:hypothetical protein
LINGVAQAAQSNSDSSSPSGRPRSPCELQLEDWYEMHPDGGKVPPQLRCGPNGEWGGPAAR